MHIALISFEYPPAVAIGGIGTYTFNAARMLAAAGHEISVFAAGTVAEKTPRPERTTIHRIPALNRADFARELVPSLLAAHSTSPIDVIEAPEIGPEGAPAFAALPSVARVLKLHTPSFLVTRFGWTAPPAHVRLRFWAASLLRGRWRTLQRPRYDRSLDPEYHGALLADEIAAPSQAIADLLTRDWSLTAHKVHVYPLPFEPSHPLLSLPPPAAVRTIGFLGRLEPRKGILEIVRALPKILHTAPHLRFRFIGPSWPFQDTDMHTWITRHHPNLADRLHFTGAVAPADLPSELAQIDAVLLPSRWENFPFACWETMAAARVVIGSNSGGMAEVIQDGLSGFLVNPRDPASIADTVLRIVRDTASTPRIATAARQRITSLLAPERVLPLQIASYQRAIARASSRRASST